MELDELKQTWTDHARKLDRVLTLNLQALQNAQLDKTRSALGRFKAYRLFEVILGVVLLIPLGSYIAAHISILTLSIPAIILAASFLLPVVGSLRQLILLGQINYADPIVVIQKQLETVKLHFVRTIRPLFFMFPLYFVYVIVGANLLFGVDLLAQANGPFLWANLMFSLLLVPPGVWAFRQLSFERMDHPIIRVFLSGGGGDQILAAVNFLHAVRAFEDEGSSETAAH